MYLSKREPYLCNRLLYTWSDYAISRVSTAKHEFSSASPRFFAVARRQVARFGLTTRTHTLGEKWRHHGVPQSVGYSSLRLAGARRLLVSLAVSSSAHRSLRLQMLLEGSGD
jgi:hypothetical protein